MHLDGHSNRSIARELNMSKDTINKYVKEYQELKSKLLQSNQNMDSRELIQAIVERPKYHSTGRKPLKVTDEMLEEIKKCLKDNENKRATGMTKQQMKLIDIHEHMIECDYDISYTTVKRIVNVEKKKHSEAFIRQEYNPGDICEFDWGEAKLNIGGNGFSKYQMAVFTPAYSNDRFAILFKAQDTPAFQQAHAEYFHYCGGSFKTMVYDNMKVAVKRFVGLHEKEPTKGLTELSIYYGFQFRFCNIASGNEKGHVERSVEYVRRKAFSGKGNDTFDTLADANKHLLDICIRLNHKHSSTIGIPYELFQEEKPKLLPQLPKFESCLISEHRVDKYSTIMVSQNHYSVPDTLVNNIVTVKCYTDKILIYYDNKIVATHNRSFLNHDWVINIQHYLRTLHKKPGALSRSTALLQADTQIQQIYNRYYSKEAKIFLDVLEIIVEKGIAAVENALHELERISPLDMSADKVRAICDHTQQLSKNKKIYDDPLSKTVHGNLYKYDELRKLRDKKQEREVINA